MTKLPISVFLIFFTFSAYSQKTGYDANFYINRGIDKSELGDYYGAIKDCNKAIELNPDIANAYYNRGVAKGELDDQKGACLDLSKAGELGYFKAYDFIQKYCK